MLPNESEPRPLSIPCNATFENYAKRIEALRYATMQLGTIRYSQVLAATYQNELHYLIGKKIKWQREHQADYQFYSDYSKIDDAVSLSEFEPKRNLRLGSTLVGRYEAYSNAIEIARDASDFVVVHESGHVLQRESLIHRSLSAPKESQTAHSNLFNPSAGTSKRDRLRLRYLTAQDELEIRLQDLNRFYANSSAAESILTPIDALRALKLVGLKLDLPSVQEALNDTGWERTSAEIKAVIDTPSPLSKSDIEAYFEDAYELILLQNLVIRYDPKSWPHILRKLLFEAPGHL